jgi:hypothetical protein
MISAKEITENPVNKPKSPPQLAQKSVLLNNSFLSLMVNFVSLKATSTLMS